MPGTVIGPMQYDAAGNFIGYAAVPHYEDFSGAVTGVMGTTLSDAIGSGVAKEQVAIDKANSDASTKAASEGFYLTSSGQNSTTLPSIDYSATDLSVVDSLDNVLTSAGFHSQLGNLFVGSGSAAPTSSHITTDLQGGFAKLTSGDDGTDIPAGGSGGPPVGSGGDGGATDLPVSRNFNPNHAANDVNPASQLPVSQTPILQAIGITKSPVNSGQDLPPAENPPATDPPATTPPANDPFSTIAALIAAQYAAAGSGNGGGGVVALPTGTVDTTAAPTTAPPSFAGIAVIVIIIGLIYFAYKHFHKHK